MYKKVDESKVTEWWFNSGTKELFSKSKKSGALKQIKFNDKMLFFETNTPHYTRPSLNMLYKIVTGNYLFSTKRSTSKCTIYVKSSMMDIKYRSIRECAQALGVSETCVRCTYQGKKTKLSEQGIKIRRVDNEDIE